MKNSLASKGTSAQGAESKASSLVAPKAMSESIPKVATRKAGGLVWTKSTDSLNKPTWETTTGLYRPQVWTGRNSRELFCSVYHLDPRFKAIDPTRDRLSQDCLLNDVHPQGATLDTIMEDTVRLIERHAKEHGRKFTEAREVYGQDLKPGMEMHHKGVFFRIQEIRLRDAAKPSEGWTVVSTALPDWPHGRGFWITPERPVTVWEDKAS